MAIRFVATPRRRALAVALPVTAALLVAVPSPAQASEHKPFTLNLKLPIALPVLTVHNTDLGVAVTDRAQSGATAYRVSIGRSTRRVHTRAVAARSTTIVRATLSSHTPAAAAGHGPLAVTAPGLISVVPLGPLPTALHPQVATARSSAQREGTAPTVLPAPPTGFWFALVLLMLLFGTITSVIGGRRLPAPRTVS